MQDVEKYYWRHFRNGLENWRRESCFTAGQCSCTQVCGCNGCCAWLWLWTGWSPSTFSWFGTIWLFLFKNMKKMAEKQNRTADEVIIFRESGWEHLYHGNPIKRCNTDGRSVWTTDEAILKNRPHFVKFDHCSKVSLWTLQPTLVV